MDAGPNAGEASWKLLAEPGVTLGLLDCGNVRLSWRRQVSGDSWASGAFRVLGAAVIFYPVLSTIMTQPYQ